MSPHPGSTDDQALLSRIPAPDWNSLAHTPHAGTLAVLAALAARLEAAPGPGAWADRSEYTAALRLLATAARPALERIELTILAHASAEGWTWADIGAVQDVDSRSAARRMRTLNRRHPDHTPPLAPTLDAHTDHARSLLKALDQGQRPSAGTAGLCAPRLGAVLLAATLIGADRATVRAWLEEDTLAEPARALLAPLAYRTDAAYQELRDHASDQAPMRRHLVDLMRAALPPTGPAESATRAAIGQAGGAFAEAADAGDLPESERGPSLELYTDADPAPETTDLGGHPHTATPAPGTEPSPTGDSTRVLSELGAAPGPGRPTDLADLVDRAGLPPETAEPLAELHAAAAPHLDRRGPTRFPVIDRLSDLHRAIDDSDPRALETAVGHLPTGGRDLFDASTLAGIRDPLGELLLALGGPAPAHEESSAGPAPAAAPSGPSWDKLAAAVLPSAPQTASAVARLLAAAHTPLSNGQLAMNSTDQRSYLALYHLHGVVLQGLGDKIIPALAEAVTIKPTRKPVNAHPEIADALRALINAYDHQ